MLGVSQAPHAICDQRREFHVDCSYPKLLFHKFVSSVEGEVNTCQDGCVARVEPCASVP